MSNADVRTVEEIGCDWEKAGWKREVTHSYTKEISPSVMDKINDWSPTSIRKDLDPAEVTKMPSRWRRITHILFGR